MHCDAIWLLLSSRYDLHQHQADKICGIILIFVMPCRAADINVILSCACHLPGVVVRAGETKWHILREMYLKFLDFPDENVRYTLGCSAHEIAAVLPPEISARDLVPGIKK